MATRQTPIRRRIGSKLRSPRGESIGEVLVALLISVIALTILAGMITSAGSILDRSRTQMNSYNATAARLVSQSGTSDGTGAVTMNVVSGGTSQTWKLTGSTSESVSVNYYVNSQFGGDPVVAYVPRS